MSFIRFPERYFFIRASLSGCGRCPLAGQFTTSFGVLGGAIPARDGAAVERVGIKPRDSLERHRAAKPQPKPIKKNLQ